VFVFKTYIETKSVITVQRHFHTQFNVERHGNIPDCNTVLRWAEAFRATESAMKRKPLGLPASVRTPERVRVAVLLDDKLQLCGCRISPYVASYTSI
jgi:hypothetical protein